MWYPVSILHSIPSSDKCPSFSSIPQAEKEDPGVADIKEACDVSCLQLQFSDPLLTKIEFSEKQLNSIMTILAFPQNLCSGTLTRGAHVYVCAGKTPASEFPGDGCSGSARAFMASKEHSSPKLLISLLRVLALYQGSVHHSWSLVFRDSRLVGKGGWLDTCFSSLGRLGALGGCPRSLA